jgi:hypothetical protein
MNQDFLTYECQHRDVLLSVLYGEASDEETVRFRSHLRECQSCTEMYNSFAAVRTSVRELRDEALLGFQPGTIPVSQPKSARSALKAFFDLSPLWLKVGTAFATAVLCVFGLLALRQANVPPVSSQMTEPVRTSNKVYSEAEFKAAVAKALAESSTVAQHTVQHDETQPQKPMDRIGMNPNPSSSIRNRRPLSRNEREQLAADLRLVKTSDNDGLELLSDRINQ